MAEPMVSFIVEYPCARGCQVEYDVTDVHARATRHQMQLHADAAHKQAHRLAAQRTFRYDPDVTVTSMAGAS